MQYRDGMLMLLVKITDHENLPMQYTEIFAVVTIAKFIRKILIYFLFLLKTWTVGKRVSTVYALKQKLENMYTHAYPRFAI